MVKSDIKKVHKSILDHGDDFWTDRPEDKEMAGNEVLFDEILSLLKEDGLTLQLIKLHKAKATGRKLNPQANQKSIRPKLDS